MSENKKTIADVIKTKTPEVVPATSETTPDYKKLYTEECAKNKTLENKCTEYEKLCKSYSERERKALETLQRATIEYNARTKYMLDCAKHAYLSMQFAIAATEQQNTPAQGGAQ